MLYHMEALKRERSGNFLYCSVHLLQYNEPCLHYFWFCVQKVKGDFQGHKRVLRMNGSWRCVMLHNEYAWCRKGQLKCHIRQEDRRKWKVRICWRKEIRYVELQECSCKSGRVITMLTVVLDYCLLATSPTYRADRSSPHPKLLIGYNGTPIQKVRMGGGIGCERDKGTRRQQT